MDIYGFAMTDSGYNFGRIDPDWFDVVRPTKLPAESGEFGHNGHTFFGVRQSRFGVKTSSPTAHGDLKTTFEFELFGVGDQAGQTTFRLRHAYGELGIFGAGQTWSPFMDPDVFPDSIEYWGPNGMVFFRNVQIRVMPLKGPASITLAAERPGSSQDISGFEEQVDIQNVSARYPVPDFSGHFRYEGDWGHVQAAGILRYIKWNDSAPSTTDLTGHAVGWGVNLSSNIKFLGKNVLKLQAVYGKAIESYMNDAGPDIGVVPVPSDVRTPFRRWRDRMPRASSGFLDITWSSALFTSSVGYSLVLVDNTSGQLPNAFKRGQYALGNLLIHPTEKFMFGAELQWGQRHNNSDNWTYDDWRVQFSARFKFGKTFALWSRARTSRSSEPHTDRGAAAGSDAGGRDLPAELGMNEDDRLPAGFDAGRRGAASCRWGAHSPRLRLSGSSSGSSVADPVLAGCDPRRAADVATLRAALARPRCDARSPGLAGARPRRRAPRRPRRIARAASLTDRSAFSSNTTSVENSSNPGRVAVTSWDSAADSSRTVGAGGRADHPPRRARPPHRHPRGAAGGRE